MEWSDGMLYPILHRLESRGLIESYWGEAEETGRKRKYYRLHQQGAEELRLQRSHWQSLYDLLQQLEGGMA